MNKSFIIFCSDSNLTVARTSAAKSEIVHVADTGAAVTALKQLDYRGEGILLALPSHWCLSARVQTHGLPNRNRQSGLLFRLEEQLPLAIEEFVADFIEGAEHAFGVAVALERLKPIVKLLEDHGIFILSICPAAVLIATQLTKCDLVLIANDASVDLIEFEHGQICQWTLLPAESDVIATHLHRAASQAGRSAMPIGLSDSLKSELAKCIDVHGLDVQWLDVQWIQSPADDPMNLAVMVANRILAEGELPAIELRRGALSAGDPLRAVRKPLLAAIAAMLLLGLALAASLLIRARQYDSLAQTAWQNQQQAFHTALPEQAAPPAITSRLMSEQRRLSALSGNTPWAPQEVSILPLLRQVLAALPRNLRFRLTELRFEPNRLYLEGQTLDHAAADQIAQAIRQGTPLSVDPPHSQQQPGEDVNFTLTAAMPEGNGASGAVAQAGEVKP